MPARAAGVQGTSGGLRSTSHEFGDASDMRGADMHSARSQSLFVGPSSSTSPQTAPVAVHGHGPAGQVQAPERLKRFIVCQKCRRPFRLLPTTKLTNKSDNSFRWIEDTGPAVMSYEQAQSIAASLFQYAADKTNVDMPLCRECNTAVGWGANGITEQYNVVKKEHHAYAATLQLLEDECAGSGAPEDHTADGEPNGGAGGKSDDLAAMQQQEADLTAQLLALRAETARIDAEQAQTTSEEAELEAEAAAFWAEVSELTVSERTLGDVHDHLTRKALVSQSELERLNSMHLLNEAFHIWCEGHFGTINTFRLGRLPSQPVDPVETNAAWGLAAQLLATLLSMWGVSTSRYKVIPKGSFSTVIKMGSKSPQVMELYVGAAGLWASTRHDNAMTGFACCLDELCKHCLHMCPNDTIPYSMDEDRVNGLSVKLSAPSQNEEKWTRALKLLLLNLKWVVTMTATHMAD
eukprot:TRINITY_DN32284_c0_g1_i1.p1 TRINITY_DN32284_c0_g1~~TRINITY_DN32284_c0_g1_i1.p1  ORF type:complete len:464 (+),score=117.70 TRINITY_DN32284_c0_g1_i1:153-1544(+)